MTDWSSELLALSHWHWWLLGLIFLGLELFTATTWFIWMAAASAIVGLFLLLMPGLHWTVQFLLFAVLSIGLISIMMRWLKKNPIQTDEPVLNQRSQQLVGRRFTLEEAVVNGQGRVRVGETWWLVRGDDAKVGDVIEITKAESNLLFYKVA